MRRAAKVDGNHADLVAGLRACGAFVQSLATVGQGCVDVLCGFRGRWFVFEIKDPAQPLHKQKLTPDEVRWHQVASLHAPVYVITTLDQAIQILTAKETPHD